MRRGFTLLEIATALAVLGVIAGLAVPAFRGAGERLAASAAREAVAGLFARARAEAPLRGGVEVVVEETPPQVRIEAGADTVAVVDVGASFGVTLDLGGSLSVARLRYDPLGIGRIASRTLVFEKGDARLLLVVSAYGRVSRR